MLKRKILLLVRKCLGLFHSRLVLKYRSYIPRFASIAPDCLIIKKVQYFDDLFVDINTRYPIERGMLSGTYEPGTTKLIRYLVKPGDVSIDAGANVGGVSLVLAKCSGRSGATHCFEPGPILFERLSKNFSYNPQLKNNGHLIKLGLSDKSSTMYWHEHESNPGDANLIDTSDKNTTPVETITIDDYVKQKDIQKMDFIKIDVESMEYEVIKGGIQTLKKFHPTIYYESLPAFEKYRGFPVFKEIEHILRGIGYSLFYCNKDGTVRPSSYPDYSHNTLAVHKTRLKSIEPLKKK